MTHLIINGFKVRFLPILTLLLPLRSEFGDPREAFSERLQGHCCCRQANPLCHSLVLEVQKSIERTIHKSPVLLPRVVVNRAVKEEDVPSAAVARTGARGGRVRSGQHLC